MKTTIGRRTVLISALLVLTAGASAAVNTESPSATAGAVPLPEPEFRWIDQFTVHEDFFVGEHTVIESGVALGDDGTIYVVGSTEVALPGQTLVGYFDAFVRAYTPTGNEKWTRQFGIADVSTYASGVAVGEGGAVYVVGTTDGALPGQVHLGSSDVFLRAYDPSGQEKWTQQFGTDQGDNGRGVAAGPSGIAVAGTNWVGTTAGWDEGFVSLFDSSGDLTWSDQFGTAEIDEVGDVAIAPDGRVHVTGFTYGLFPNQLPWGNADAFLRSYRPSGGVLGTWQFGTLGDDQGRAVTVDRDGFAWVAGSTSGALPGQTTAGGTDAFVRVSNTSGAVEYYDQFGSADHDEVAAVAAARNGQVIVAGSTSGTMPGHANLGETDSFLRVYRSGVVQWDDQIGTANSDWGTGVTISASGNPVLTGATVGQFPGQTTAVDTLDIFVMKMFAPPLCDGWAATLVGTSGDDTVTGTSGRDVIIGLGGDDIIDGRGGDDVICAGSGNDEIRGKAGNDYLYGDDGHDKLNGGTGNDFIDGGSGKDTVAYFGAADGVIVNLSSGSGGGSDQGADTLAGVEHVMGSLHGDVLKGNGGGNRLKGLAGRDELRGMGGNDTLIGAGNNDSMYGGSGDDLLQGKAGFDRLFGGPGDDTLEGNVGDDVLYGGDGVDRLNGGSGDDTCYDGETKVSCELPL
jgi:Ca2+-binding RTX toxin-like protein